MAARRTKCRAGGRTTGRARSGDKRPEFLSEQEQAIRRAAHEQNVGAPYIGTPFYSDALRAWRVECIIPDPHFPGGTWQSSFFTKAPEDASRLHATAVRTVKGKEDWQRVRETARELAEAQREGSIAHMNRTS